MNEILERGRFTGEGRLMEGLTKEFAIVRLDENTRSILNRQIEEGPKLPSIVPVSQIISGDSESEDSELSKAASPVHMGIFNYKQELVLNLGILLYAAENSGVIPNFSSQSDDPNIRFIATIRETLAKHLPEQEPT